MKLSIKPLLRETAKEKSPILSSPSPEKSSNQPKTPDNCKFEFQNKIFDFKEIQSPNVLFKDYGNIFNDEDELSEGEIDKNTKRSKSRVFTRSFTNEMKPNDHKAA